MTMPESLAVRTLRFRPSFRSSHFRAGFAGWVSFGSVGTRLGPIGRSLLDDESPFEGFDF